MCVRTKDEDPGERLCINLITSLTRPNRQQQQPKWRCAHRKCLPTHRKSAFDTKHKNRHTLYGICGQTNFPCTLARVRELFRLLLHSRIGERACVSVCVFSVHICTIGRQSARQRRRPGIWLRSVLSIARCAECRVEWAGGEERSGPRLWPVFGRSITDRPSASERGGLHAFERRALVHICDFGAASSILGPKRPKRAVGNLLSSTFYAENNFGLLLMVRVHYCKNCFPSFDLRKITRTQVVYPNSVYLSS